VGRLKSAGWHFDDSDLSVGRVQDRRRVLDRIVEELTDLRPGEAVRLALELEDGDAYRYYSAAVTPQDTTMAASLDAATPPAPSLQLLDERISAAKARYSDGQIGADLDQLGHRLSIEMNPQDEDLA
jgi:hypothetical protein